MLVCAINGSHRGSRGATHRLLERMGAGVRGAGGTWDPVQLAELRIEPCRACNQCQRSGSFQCIYEDKDQVGHLERRSAAAWTKALQGDDPAEKQRAEAILESFETAGRDLVTQGRIRPSTARAAGKPFIKVPALVRLARHLPFLRPRIAQEIQRRAGTITMGPD